MKTVLLDKIASGDARLPAQAGGAGERRDPVRGGGGGGGAGAGRQEHLQPAGAAERPDGAGQEGRRDRRRARPSQRALRLLQGYLPRRLAPGERVNLLNLGGVLGICDSVNPDLGPPFRMRGAGSGAAFPLSRRGASASRRASAPGWARARSTRRRLWCGGRAAGAGGGVEVGSCMNSGKTAAACALVRHFSHGGLTVDALKATGVSLRRDDAGDGGRRGAHDGALHRSRGGGDDAGQRAGGDADADHPAFAAGRPDVIVAELGDGPRSWSLRRRRHPRRRGDPAPLSRRWCWRPTIRWRRGAASACWPTKYGIRVAAVTRPGDRQRRGDAHPRGDPAGAFRQCPAPTGERLAALVLAALGLRAPNASVEPAPGTTPARMRGDEAARAAGAETAGPERRRRRGSPGGPRRRCARTGATEDAGDAAAAAVPARPRVVRR